MTTEPQYVFGAAMLGWHLDTEIKSEHQTDCRLRWDRCSGKKGEQSALRISVSLDTGRPHTCYGLTGDSVGMSPAPHRVCLSEMEVWPQTTPIVKRTHRSTAAMVAGPTVP